MVSQDGVLTYKRGLVSQARQMGCLLIHTQQHQAELTARQEKGERGVIMRVSLLNISWYVSKGVRCASSKKAALTIPKSF